MRALYERIKEARTELHLSQDYVAKFWVLIALRL